jgi:hypothetical protein
MLLIWRDGLVARRDGKNSLHDDRNAQMTENKKKSDGLSNRLTMPVGLR